MVVALLLPVSAHAGVFSAFAEKVRSVFLSPTESLTVEESATSQTMPVFKPVVVGEDDGLEELDASSGGALSATTGSLRVSTEDIEYPASDTISVYEVKKGDTLSTVAKLFGVSKNTIVWANDLTSERLTPGDTLVILPITGVRHTVKKGDTVASIAKKYKGDADDIAKYNGVSPDASLALGEIILVPEGEIAVAAPKITAKPASSGTVSGLLARPLVGGRKTQSIHGNNGVDIAALVGTPVLASADGQIISAKSSGYNGGYGSMIIIKHNGKLQTLYAHLSTVDVVVGQYVSKGQVIGAVGNTGRSTGPHLHFEVRGGKNPF
jgi:murein DD-endopeptidase MepM/ murein hydrolase activator NlpD